MTANLETASLVPLISCRKVLEMSPKVRDFLDPIDCISSIKYLDTETKISFSNAYLQKKFRFSDLNNYWPKSILAAPANLTRFKSKLTFSMNTLSTAEKKINIVDQQVTIECFLLSLFLCRPSPNRSIINK
jgi:hypothetical protein